MVVASPIPRTIQRLDYDRTVKVSLLQAEVFPWPKWSYTGRILLLYYPDNVTDVLVGRFQVEFPPTDIMRTVSRGLSPSSHPNSNLIFPDLIREADVSSSEGIDHSQDPHMDAVDEKLGALEWGLRTCISV
jgi:hypothetical protein